jgi:hypothetical protein
MGQLPQDELLSASQVGSSQRNARERDIGIGVGPPVDVDLPGLGVVKEHPLQLRIELEAEMPFALLGCAVGPEEQRAAGFDRDSVRDHALARAGAVVGQGIAREIHGTVAGVVQLDPVIALADFITAA